MGPPLAGPRSSLFSQSSSLSLPGVSTGNVCPLMLLPTAASARMGTQGLCATRSGLWQSPVGACSACMATARPQPPKRHTVCATLAFQASCVSKVRGPPPDCPLQGPSPPFCRRSFTLSSSNPSKPFILVLLLPSPLVHRGLLGFCTLVL